MEPSLLSFLISRIAYQWSPGKLLHSTNSIHPPHEVLGDQHFPNKLINKFYKLLKGKIEIIGVGGVDSGESAYKKFQAGASYVQLYTGMVFQGPNVVAKIKKELKELLLKDGVKNFSEIVGKKD